jgi:hypothetical protein
VTILLLSLALICVVVVMIWFVRQNVAWKADIYELAGYKGVHRAMADFDAGRLRVFLISGRSLQDTFTGTNDGPFEVWISHFFPDEPYPVRFALEQEVAFYNAKMRLLQQAHATRLTNSVAE